GHDQAFVVEIEFAEDHLLQQRGRHGLSETALLRLASPDLRDGRWVAIAKGAVLNHTGNSIREAGRLSDNQGICMVFVLYANLCHRRSVGKPCSAVNCPGRARLAAASEA